MESAIAEISKKVQSLPSSGTLPNRPLSWGRICVPVPFADFDFYYTDGPLVWYPNNGSKLPAVVVPHGFCTDLTSVPQVFWSAVPKTGKYAYAAIVHDYLYWTQSTTRLVADDVLWDAMEDSQVDTVTKNAIYGSVRSPFGQSAWDGNKNTRASKKEWRFLKQFPPRTRLVTWSEWKKKRANFSD